MSTRCLFVIWLGIVSLGSIDCSKKDALKPVYEWKYLDYDFGSEAARKAAIETGEYDYKKGIPVDVDRYENTTFVTVIRKNGVPSSLNTVTNKTGPGGPLLKPYPAWSWAKLGNCSGITNVFRVAIDYDGGKLWIIDNGRVDYTILICDPQILVFDLKTSELLKRVKIPIDIANNSNITRPGLPVTPALDDNIVYIANLDNAFIVYNDTDDNFKRFTSSDYNHNGIVGMAYSDWTGRLYYSLSGSDNLGVLHDVARSPYNRSDLEYKDFFCTKTSVIATGRGYVFFGLVGDSSIASYHEYNTLQPNHTFVVAKNSETLQLTSGLKYVHQSDELWALSIKYEEIQPGPIHVDEVKFRILKSDLNTLLNIHPCTGRFCFRIGTVIFPPPLPTPSSLLNQTCGPVCGPIYPTYVP